MAIVYLFFKNNYIDCSHISPVAFLYAAFHSFATDVKFAEGYHSESAKLRTWKMNSLFTKIIRAKSFVMKTTCFMFLLLKTTMALKS